MALLAESLVEEYYNRLGYFTIRGVRRGNHEIDVLAIKPHSKEALHIEVQVSFRPVSYISELPKDIAKKLNRPKNSSAKREDYILETGIANWIHKKYESDIKVEIRDMLYPNAKWNYVFVHGVVHETKELNLIKASGWPEPPRLNG